MPLRDLPGSPGPVCDRTARLYLYIVALRCRCVCVIVLPVLVTLMSVHAGNGAAVAQKMQTLFIDDIDDIDGSAADGRFASASTAPTTRST